MRKVISDRYHIMTERDVLLGHSASFGIAERRHRTSRGIRTKYKGITQTRLVQMRKSLSLKKKEGLWF